jgi:hypothetical protein
MSSWMTAELTGRFQVSLASDCHFSLLRTRGIERTLMSWLRTAVSLIRSVRARR